jgi:uncharacterized protein (DUF1330 family)
MAAYVILDVEITDRAAYEDYKTRAGAALARYGGRFLVRGGTAEVVEGEWTPNRIVVLEFESADRARQWYASPEYAEAKEIRLAASRGNMILVEGV